MHAGRLAGRCAVVTGGARGIGAAIVRAAVADGARVIIFDVDGEGATSIANAIGERCQARVVAVSDEAGRRRRHRGRGLLVRPAGQERRDPARGRARRPDARRFPRGGRHEPHRHVPVQPSGIERDAQSPPRRHRQPELGPRAHRRCPPPDLFGPRHTRSSALPGPPRSPTPRRESDAWPSVRAMSTRS